MIDIKMIHVLQFKLVKTKEQWDNETETMKLRQRIMWEPVRREEKELIYTPCLLTKVLIRLKK